MAERLRGTHIFNGLNQHSTCPAPILRAAREAADGAYCEIVERVDWSRILIEASGIHLESKCDRNAGVFDSICGRCLGLAMLNVERKYGECETPPPAVEDWGPLVPMALVGRDLPRGETRYPPEDEDDDQ